VELVEIDRWKPFAVLLQVESTHPNFPEVARVETVPEISVVKKATSLSAPAWMLSVFSDSTVA
jgi:hypothetical protein